MTNCLRVEEKNRTALNGKNLYLNLPKLVNEIGINDTKLRNLHILHARKTATTFLHKIITMILTTRRFVSYSMFMRIC